MKIGRVYATFQTDLKYSEHYLAKELSKDGHLTTFITSDKYLQFWKKYLKNYQKQGTYTTDYFKIIRLAAFFPLEKVIFKNWFKLYGILFNSKFDIFHLYGLGNLSSILVLFLATLKGKSSPPIIISDHTNPITHKRDGAFSRVYYFFMRMFIAIFKSKIEKIITFSEVGTDILSKRFNLPKKFFTSIPLGYDHDRYKYIPKIKNSNHKFVIGFAGKIDQKKRIDFLIETLSEIDLIDKIKLIIVGIKKNDDYCTYIESLGDNSNLEIEFRPFLETYKLAEFYNFVDLVIYPGSISITTIEANGCGTPVIIYKSIDKLESRVEDGRGLLFSTKNELLDSIKFYYNLYISKKISNNSIYEVTKKKYAWSVIKDDYLKIYNTYV